MVLLSRVGAYPMYTIKDSPLDFPLSWMRNEAKTAALNSDVNLTHLCHDILSNSRA